MHVNFLPFTWIVPCYRLFHRCRHMDMESMEFVMGFQPRCMARWMGCHSNPPALAAKMRTAEIERSSAKSERVSIGEQIAAFLDGRTNGEGLLHTLYDHILDEPIPQSMRAILGEPPARAR